MTRMTRMTRETNRPKAYLAPLCPSHHVAGVVCAEYQLGEQEMTA